MARRTHDPIVRLDRADLIDVLEAFEVEYERATGEALSSEDFYVQYRAGRHDDIFSMAWASYIEASERLNDSRRTEIAELLEEALPPVAVGL